MKRIRPIFHTLRFHRSNWKAVALCFFAATVFWFFNALNKTYTTNLKFPLRFEYDQNNYVPLRALPKEVRLNVTGNGWALFRRSAGVKVPPLEIPLERPTDTKRIVGSTLPPFFSNQLEGLQINYVLADTLYIDIEPKTGRWIRLALDRDLIDVRDGYGLSSNISILPDSIFIEGPRPLIQGFTDTLQLEFPFRDIAVPFMEDVEVKINQSETIRRDPPTVAVMFTVEQYLSITDSVKLSLVNVPRNVRPLMGKASVAVKIRGPQSLVTNSAIDSVKAIVDLEGLKKGQYKVLPRIENLPKFTELIAIDSVSIKF